MKDYDGWIMKSHGYFLPWSFNPIRSNVVKDWNKRWGATSSMRWKNFSRRVKTHKIVKVKLIEVSE